MAGFRGLSAGAGPGAALPELETARLALRLARPGMEGAMARFLEENFEGHLDRWSPPATPSFFTAAFWRERLAIAVEEFHAGRSARFVMQEKGAPDAPIVGTCNYTNIVRGPFQACHLGYQIARSHEGRGLMTEALRATNAFMFDVLRLHRIMANYRPENARSARVLERLGFRREGLARDYLFIDGAWRDHVLTALVHPAYDPSWVEPAGRA
ncbi:MAG TPA: GNAT family N-acetyltransferase [Usitatibacter sp.]|nr:GNAT family N-acetyltransferase [Usitatibacter sp.]